jgi:transcriptional regulator with XRE-family HTH domain
MHRRRRNPGAKAPEPKDVEIGQRIRARRLLCRLSQTALADTIGRHLPTGAEIRAGREPGRRRRLARIAEVLSVPITFFFDGAARPRASAGKVNEALGLVRTAGAMRLAQAFAAMPAAAREHFLALVEIVAERGRSHRTR